MSINRRNLIWMIPLLLLATFPVWRLPLAAFLAPRGGFDQDFGKREHDPHNFTMEQIIILQNQKGAKTAEIRANKARTSEVPNEFILDEVNADLFDNQSNRINVLARTGIYNTDTKYLTLHGDVRVDQTAEKQQLYTEELHYDDHDRTITSPVATRLVGEHAEIDGSSLFYNLVSRQYLVGGRVSCKIEGIVSP